MITCPNSQCQNFLLDLMKVDPLDWKQCCRHAERHAPEVQRWHYHVSQKSDEVRRYTGAKSKCPFCRPKKSKGAAR